MELTATIESSCARDAAPGDGAGSGAARDMEGIRSDEDAPGATRARGGSPRPSQAGGAAAPAAGSAGPAAGSAAGGDGAAGAALIPRAAPPGGPAGSPNPAPANQKTSAHAAAPAGPA